MLRVLDFKSLRKVFLKKSADFLKYMSKGKQKVGNFSQNSPANEPKKVSVSNTLPSDCSISKEQKPKVFKHKK
jgi:hypothetical protein